MFEINHNEASSSGGLMPVGEYECIIKSALEDVTKGGTIFINVPLVVRNDIEQPYKNAYIWHSIWQVKEPKEADKACQGFSSFGIQSLSKAAGLQNGKKYASLAEWGADLKLKLVRVSVKHEEYQGNTQAKVKFVNETKFPTCNHVWKNQPASAGLMPDGIKDDDLPF
jgi:hypothetical protein